MVGSLQKRKDHEWLGALRLPIIAAGRYPGTDRRKLSMEAIAFRHANQEQEQALRSRDASAR